MLKKGETVNIISLDHAQDLLVEQETGRKTHGTSQDSRQKDHDTGLVLRKDNNATEKVTGIVSNLSFQVINYLPVIQMFTLRGLTGISELLQI